MAIELWKSATGTNAVRETTPAKAVPARAGGSGQALPDGGKDVPVRAEPPPIDISRAITNLNRFLQDSQRDFLFRLDQSSGRTIITIVNPSTGEIVRQIPPEEVLNAARTLRDAGILLSARA